MNLRYYSLSAKDHGLCDRVSHQNLELPSYATLVGLGQSSQGSCLYLLNTGIAGMHYHVHLFTWVLGVELISSCL